jgi:hypothetical protein
VLLHETQNITYKIQFHTKHHFKPNKLKMENNIENTTENGVNRRQFLHQLGAITVASALPASVFALPKPTFEISLAEFSLAGSLFSGKLKNLDFPAKAKNDFGINAVEYVSGFWEGKSQDQAYLNELKQRTEDLGVRNVLTKRSRKPL